jgi:hypothetical protein
MIIASEIASLFGRVTDTFDFSADVFSNDLSGAIVTISVKPLSPSDLGRITFGGFT